MEVELISQCFVKPSSPTPDHLRRCPLSSLDQIAFSFFSPWLFFYPRKTNVNNTARCQSLKESLSNTLTLYHPLAGRTGNSMYIDCNDEGVPFVEAKADCTISDVLRNPYCNELNKLLPFELEAGSTDVVVFIQATYFKCGGLAVGLGMSHKLCDAFSVVTFVRSWAAIARGDINSVIVPRFDGAKYFPPVSTPSFDPWFESDANKDRTVLKRFLFSSASISALREKYVDNSRTGRPKHPTRSEALTAFLCSRFVASTQCEQIKDKLYAVHHSVNLRSRMDPPLSEHHFGNFIVVPVVAVPDIDAADGNYGIISQMKGTMGNVEKEYIKIFQQGDPHLTMMKERDDSASNGEAISHVFTNVSAFPVYEIDFGWGKPVWVGTACWPLDNLIILVATKAGNGIEAFIHMKEKDMAKFETDHELLSFVSPIPNLNISSL